jgi:hypothetical protein
MVLTGGAAILMLYRLLLKYAPFLGERGMPAKFFSTWYVPPMPDLMRKLCLFAVVLSFCMVILVSPLFVLNLLNATSPASLPVRCFGIALTAYLYCALVAILALSARLRLNGLNTQAWTKPVQNAYRRNGMFYIVYATLIVIGYLLGFGP